MFRKKTKMIVLATILVVAASSCRFLPSHDENGPSAYVDILAIGDSYTAGNAATDGGGNDGYFFQSPDDPRAEADVRQRSNPAFPLTKDCFRNSNNYSQTLYELLGSSGAHINAACSGDTTAEVLNTNGSSGQLNGFNEDQRNEVDLVTISIGGNDLNFADVVAHCFSPDESEIHCGNSLTAAETMLDDGSLHNDIKTALQHVSAQLPSAKVVLVGYPLFWEEPVYVGNVAATDRLRAGLEELNILQGMVVNELNGSDPGTFAFLPLHMPDTNNDGYGEGFFDHHGVGGDQEQWIQNIGGTAYPEEWVHPTAAGHAAIAEELHDMSFVQQVLNDRIRAGYPKLSLTNVDGQWYALDDTGKLWKVTVDFVRCQLPDGPYHLASWRNPQQLFTAATNSAPYPDMPNQPGCNSNIPREGDIIRATNPGSFPDYWIVSYGENNQPQRTLIFQDGYNRRVPPCLSQRGARLFEVDGSVLANTYQDTGEVFDDPTCHTTHALITDTSNRYWMVEEDSSGLKLHLVVDSWMEECLDNNTFTTLNAWSVDIENNPLYANASFDYSGYTDARCLDPTGPVVWGA